MRAIKYIVLHCTATPQTATIESIKRYWKEVMKWREPGYHFMIKPDGEIVNTQKVEKLANGAAGYNSESIHISYIGGVIGKAPVDNRTPEQRRAMEDLVRTLKRNHPNAIIQGHRDFPGVRKACPSFEVKEWLKEIGL